MKSNTKKIALCGVLGALAVTILMMGFLFPFATYACPAIAASIILIIVYEFGFKTGLTLYAAVSFLAFMLVPDHELVLMFVFVFGFYTVIKMPLDKKLGKKGRIAAKFIYVNLSVAAVYAILLVIFPVGAIVNEFREYSLPFMALLMVLFWLVFFMYDKASESVLLIYIRKFRKIFFR